MNRRGFFSGLAAAAVLMAMSLAAPLVAEARAIDTGGPAFAAEKQFIMSLMGNVSNDVALYAVDGGVYCQIRCQKPLPNGGVDDYWAVTLDKAPGRLEAMREIAIEHNRSVVVADLASVRRTTERPIA